MSKTILTPKAAGKILKCSAHHVRWLIREGRLKAVRKGPPGVRGWYEIDPADLDKIERYKRGPKPKKKT